VENAEGGLTIERSRLCLMCSAPADPSASEAQAMPVGGASCAGRRHFPHHPIQPSPFFDEAEKWRRQVAVLKTRLQV